MTKMYIAYIFIYVNYRTYAYAHAHIRTRAYSRSEILFLQKAKTVMKEGVTWAIAGSLVGQIRKFVANIYSRGKYICALSFFF